MPTTLHEDVRRTAAFSVRLRPRELELVDRAAKRAGLTRAEFAAAAVMRAVDAWLRDGDGGDADA
jgi:uncharacterized protein (DUF1778 family)